MIYGDVMDQLWKKSYFNRRSWLMEHITDLNLNEREFMLLMLIDFLNEQHRPISLDVLSKMTNLTMNEIDECLSRLCMKQYLQIVPKKGMVEFRMDGIFEKKEEMADHLPLFSTFEQEFGRPLTQKEATMLTEWMRHYEQDLILYALREAAIYHKLNIHYIDTILSNWEKNHVTVQMLEEGKEHENG